MPSMFAPHNEPNSAFHGAYSTPPWIEIYHSRPTWTVSQISFRPDGNSWVPFGKFQLIAADDIRPGFRAFRTQATSLEFRLADGRLSVIDSNHGLNYHISTPGRYVVESGHGVRRVSDAQIPDCLRPGRPDDAFVELMFAAVPRWRKAYVTYKTGDDGDPTWFKTPMQRGRKGWFQRVEAKEGITCAFTDGGELWDSNQEQNYHIRLPGKYLLGGGTLLYAGPADLDEHK